MSISSVVSFISENWLYGAIGLGGTLLAFRKLYNYISKAPNIATPIKAEVASITPAQNNEIQKTDTVVKTQLPQAKKPSEKTIGRVDVEHLATSLQERIDSVRYHGHVKVDFWNEKKPKVIQMIRDYLKENAPRDQEAVFEKLNFN